MILRRVEISQFGKWTDRVFEFRRGANLVIGANESGKTTLVAAIIAVLFGLKDKERFVPWAGNGECDAALVWEDQQRFWRLERNIRTDEVVLTVWHEGGEVLRDFAGKVEAGSPSGEYAELLRDLLCLDGSDPVTASTIRTFIEDDSFSLPGMACFSQSRQRGDSPGNALDSGEELLMIQRQLAELGERWYALRPVHGQLEEIVRQLAALQDELAALDAAPQPLPKAIAPAVLQKSGWSVSMSEGVTAKLNRRQQLQEELTRLGLPVDMPADLPLLLAEAEALRRELVSLQKESVRIREARANRSAPPWKMAAIISALPLLFGIAGSLWLAWGVTGAMGGALLAALVWLVNGHFHGLHLAEDARLKGQAQAFEERREVAQELLSAMDERFRGMNISPSAVSLVKMQKSIERGRVIADELRTLDGALSVLEEVGVEEAELISATPLEGEVEPSAAPLSAETLSLLERHRQLSQEQDRLQGLVRERQQVEEEGERLRERETLLARQLKDDAAGAKPMGGRAASAGDRSFADECARLLGLMGGRRPFQVAVDDKGCLVMNEGERGAWRPPFAYGHGASDLLGLAARLAANGACHLPILLDESLVHLERGRVAEVFGALERIAAQRQVIVFCREDQLPKRLARERWQVLSLDEEPMPKERDDHAGQLHLL